MQYAAFFRNLNLGRPNCPTKAQLEDAFMRAGAASAASFLTNGTLVFTVPSAGRAHRVFAGACELLRETCGLREPGYVRSLEHLARLVALDPFSAVDRDQVYACCVTFLHPDSAAAPALPLTSPRGDVQVLYWTGPEALSLSFKPGQSPGSPNAFLEKLLGLPATTRNWNTVQRLVRKHAGPTDR